MRLLPHVAQCTVCCVGVVKWRCPCDKLDIGRALSMEDKYIMPNKPTGIRGFKHIGPKHTAPKHTGLNYRGCKFRAVAVYVVLVATNWVQFALQGCAPAPRFRDTTLSAEPRTTSFVGRKVAEQMLSDTSLRGLSGLEVRGNRVWAVAERDRFIFEFKVEGDALQLVKKTPVAGIEDNTDTEALARLHDGKFILGTERHVDQRDSDALLVVKLIEGRYGVSDVIQLPYQQWGIQAEDNRGIEGVCAVGHLVLTAVESTPLHEGKRYAPLARYDLDTKAWTPFRVWLSTEKGMISSLACRDFGDSAEVIAIERHYGIGKVLRFVVPKQGSAQDISPEVLLNYAAFAGKSAVPNFEGIDWLGGKRIVLMSDNQTKTVDGPTLVWILE